MPLTAAADGTLRGNGPLSWTRSTWTMDDDGTMTNQGGGTRTIDDQWSLITGAGPER